MKEKTIDDILLRLKKIFNSKIYRSNLTNPKVSWLDITIEEAIDKVLNYISNLNKQKVG